MNTSSAIKQSAMLIISAFKKYFLRILNIFLVVACFGYSLWDVDITRLRAVFNNYSFGLLIAAQLYVLVALLPSAFRIRFLSQKRANLIESIEALFLGLGVNNMLPLKLGEVAKAIFLQKNVKMPLAEGLNIVFWERFSDLNALLILAGISITIFMKKSPLFLVLFGIVAGIWCFLLIHKRGLKIIEKVSLVINLGRWQRFINEFLSHIKDCLQARFLLILAAHTVVVWIFLVSILYVIIWYVSGLNLSFGQILIVVIMSSLGMSVPSLPGAIGVYEASIVVALTYFGVAKEEALAAAIILHLMQYIPTTIGALLIMIKTKLIVKSFRLPLQEGTADVIKP
jgi:uncharacterized protein (TIRG00374 family)